MSLECGDSSPLFPRATCRPTTPRWLTAPDPFPNPANWAFAQARGTSPPSESSDKSEHSKAPNFPIWSSFDFEGAVEELVEVDQEGVVIDDQRGPGAGGRAMRGGSFPGRERNDGHVAG